ncbi:type VI secretion system baseplate subunit TssE [Rugamonas sp. CCM 8940]|uniref:type VI secretion system baseplate subunit TssE n=1 Tax=Rugamonas sp. CCM 8940 TaxID=2765359 RepID=UPI0018F5FE3C|nr:type VI secretion system baseplate subunit TssE [Rugamonas sp. CCM 8940]MBJ7313461.1 type VI secretion system baseplate subunit TssE [Rugamonas sp. CCM 8940]
MADLDLLQGARAPLFERFGGDAAEAGFLPWRPGRRDGLELALSALERSIGAELARLLNTRCAASMAQLAERERTVLDYGLPDYSAYYTGSLDDRQRLTALVRSTIVAFEPRLRDVDVELALPGHSRQALDVTVRAGVMLEGRLEPVAFQVAALAEKGAA